LGIGSKVEKNGLECELPKISQFPSISNINTKSVIYTK
jgi:hypothetical protein